MYTTHKRPIICLCAPCKRSNIHTCGPCRHSLRRHAPCRRSETCLSAPHSGACSFMCFCAPCRRSETRPCAPHTSALSFISVHHARALRLVPVHHAGTLSVFMRHAGALRSAEAPRSLTLNDGLPCCRCAGGRPQTHVPRVYPCVAVPTSRPGTRVADSERRSAGSLALFDVF